MAKMQVYLPAELYRKVKARGSQLNVSNVLQRALEQELLEIERRAALAEAVQEYASKKGRFTQRELDAREASDRRAARRPSARRRRRRAA
jgi:post-segregation antitoxin (ccd killing protein)